MSETLYAVAAIAVVSFVTWGLRAAPVSETYGIGRYRRFHSSA